MNVLLFIGSSHKSILVQLSRVLNRAPLSVDWKMFVGVYTGVKRCLKISKDGVHSDISIVRCFDGFQSLGGWPIETNSSRQKPYKFIGFSMMMVKNPMNSYGFYLYLNASALDRVHATALPRVRPGRRILMLVAAVVVQDVRHRRLIPGGASGEQSTHLSGPHTELLSLRRPPSR